MRTWLRPILVGGLIAVAWPVDMARAQEGDYFPTIEIIGWYVERDGDTIAVFDRNLGIGTRVDVETYIHEELDFVTVIVEVFDQDWTESEFVVIIVGGEPIFVETSDADEVFLRFEALGLPWGPPEAPPIGQASNLFFGRTTEAGFGPDSVIPGGDPNDPADYRLVYGDDPWERRFQFYVPEFLGKNQARLRGEIDFDVAWLLTFSASNEQEPEEGLGVPSDFATLRAIEKPSLAPVNPPAFADAGADRTVPAGFEVVLDGSRTFDSYNVGFDQTDDEDIFEKDKLTFTWEWISGPVRVDPVQTDPRDPMATVLLTIPDPNNPYVYRLLVDDNVNPLPSSDSVAITVVAELPGKNPPAVSNPLLDGIPLADAGAQTVGSVITLTAQVSDPDDPQGQSLRYRWTQTNELGGALAPDELQDAFQPISGMTEPESRWQVLTAGTFYFRLLVDDGEFRSSKRFSIEVIETATGGASEALGGGDAAGGSAGDDGAGQQSLPAPALCGAGMLPLAAVPLALGVLRRRRR